MSPDTCSCDHSISLPPSLPLAPALLKPPRLSNRPLCYLHWNRLQGHVSIRPLDNYLGLIKPFIIQAANQAPKYKGFLFLGSRNRGQSSAGRPQTSEVRTGPTCGTVPGKGLSQCCHFTGENTEAQRRDGTCLRSHSKRASGWQGRGFILCPDPQPGRLPTCQEAAGPCNL